MAERNRVLTLDVRSHGLSRPAPFNIAAAKADLLALLDELQVQQATFVGHSMGGNLIQELAFHHPGRVKALVFVDCTHNFQKLSAAEKFGLSLAVPIFKLYPYQTLVDQSLTVTALLKASQDLLRQSMGSLGKDEFIQIMMATSACLHEEPGYTIGKPMLMILGDKDRTGNIRKVMPQWAAIEPHCRLVIVPQALHAPNLDAPELFHRELLEFLAQTS